MSRYINTSLFKTLVANTNKIFRAICLATGLFIAFSMQAFAQDNSQDLWACFNVVSELDEFKSHFPMSSNGAILSHQALNNGFPFPESTDEQPVEVLDKSELFDGNHSNFFVFQKFIQDGDDAHLELVYYYDFEGQFRHFQSGRFDLTKNDEGWAITNSEFNQSND